MLNKEKLLQTIKNLPEQFSMEEFFERTILMQKIEAGLELSKNGQTVSSEEARKRLSKWLLK
jgi:hypothetical protein